MGRKGIRRQKKNYGISEKNGKNGIARYGKCDNPHLRIMRKVEGNDIILGTEGRSNEGI